MTFIDEFRRAAGGGGPLSFAAFMELALYHPEAGYYRRSRPRVGYGPGTDFLTATASAPLFGRLVAAASAEILGGAAPAATHAFVEIGAEPGTGVLAGAEHPFRSESQLRLGDPLLIAGPCVAFSNELFDAQPFRRFLRRAGAWRELGVAIRETGLAEVELPGEPDFSDEPLAGGRAGGGHPGLLPPDAPDGYRFDAPLAAAALARRIAAQPWTGLFIAFDYGKSWEELATATPGGTARTYHRHAQGSDLLESPGERDLTCHVCWDWIARSLAEAGFREPCVESQEAFFTRHAGGAIEQLLASEAGRLGPVRRSVLNLLHPANLGNRFQVLWALR